MAVNSVWKVVKFIVGLIVVAKGWERSGTKSDEAVTIYIEPNTEKIISFNYEFEFSKDILSVYNIFTANGYVLTFKANKVMKCHEGSAKVYGDDDVFIREYCNKLYMPAVSGSKLKIEVECKSKNNKCVNDGRNMEYEFTVYSRTEPFDEPPKKPNPEAKCQCGTPAINGNRIVGGERVLQGEIPWQVLIKSAVGDSRTRVFCGGTLISRNYVVTTARCVMEAKPHNLLVLYGTVDSYDNKKHAKVNEIKIHEKYNYDQKWHDIALLKLDQSINYDEDTLPACLPARLINIPLTNKTMTVSGWGASEFEGAKKRFLEKTTVEGMSYGTCVALTEGIYNQLCADRQRHDACDGDEGGPLTLIDNGIHYLMGVNSLGNCGGGMLSSIYTRVTGYIRWMYQTTEKDLCFK